MLKLGTLVRSKRDNRLRGRIVGYGSLQWPSSQNFNGDPNPVVVYLVKVAAGSNMACNSCVVMRTDMVDDLSISTGNS